MQELDFVDVAEITYLSAPAMLGAIKRDKLLFIMCRGEKLEFRLSLNLDSFATIWLLCVSKFMGVFVCFHFKKVSQIVQDYTGEFEDSWRWGFALHELLDLAND